MLSLAHLMKGALMYHVISNYSRFQNCHGDEVTSQVGASTQTYADYCDFVTMTILKPLVMANPAHTWWYDKAPLVPV